MNLHELDTYKLSDAVKFHNRLNPRIWGADEQLLPEVRSKLLEIAADFQEFLGLSDLDVQDITLSGSNAAYSYTPHSDIDLHLVVNVPDDEVYQELFNAKKYQYNDMHDIRVRGADVELYVQPADESVKSLGEYSVQHNKWIQVPRRKRAEIDQNLVRHKYEDLMQRIKAALKEDDSDRVEALIAKIKTMRQSGLDEHGEFGPENLAFKMLRTQGWIKKLYDHRAATRDRELSLKEQPSRPFIYGFKLGQSNTEPRTTPVSSDDYHNLFKIDPNKQAETPPEFNKQQDYEWWLEQQRKKKDLASEGHQGQPYSSEDGVAPSTCMFLNEEQDQEAVVHEFIQWVADRLGIDQLPEIFIHTDPQWSVEEHSFGRYEPDTHSLHVNMANRHLFDILRTTAHELVHCRQNQHHPLPADAGKTGSRWENEAHAKAGVIMRDFADAHPELFDTPALQESASGYIPTKKQARDPRYAMALTVDIKPGEVGRQANKMGLETDNQGHPKMVYKSVNRINESRNDGNEPRGPEFRPTMPRGTVRVDVSDMYDWYKLGQHISNLKGLGRHDFGAGPPSTIISFGDEDLEHQYIDALKQTGLTTTDIDPAAHDPKKGQKTDPTYNVAEEDELVESLRQEFALLEDEYLGEIRMSPTNLRAEAAKTGAMAGMEFEMIVPNVRVDEEPEYEPDYDQDQRTRSFSDIVNFFYDGDYNGRRDVVRLEEELQEQFEEWLEEQIFANWQDDGIDYLRDYIENNGYFDDAEANEEATNALQAEYGNDISPEDFQKMLDALVKEKFDEFVQDQWDNQGSYYDDALDQFRDEQRQDIDESDWLHEHYPYMTDIQNNFDIAWPYYYDTNEGAGDMDIESVADDFSRAVGMKVNWSSSYHGGRREPDAYVVEPDGSLDPNDSDDGGLEFVSPPMPIDKMIDQLNKVKAWAGDYGCYTNRSTGLHINISVPNYDLAKLDYVKLALLLGDKYILDQYGRSSNTYAKSALGKVQDLIKRDPSKGKELLDKMRGHMEDLATKSIHSGSTDKYTSINTKSGYIEFRSPGGDWLDANFDKIENTLLRFTVALSAAMDPAAYREEYLKKLYKLLEPVAEEAKGLFGKGAKDTVKYFADYVAGKTPKAALRSFVKQAQLERRLKKGNLDGQQYWWRVDRDGRGADNSPSIEVVATSKEEALAKARKEWNIPDGSTAMAKADAYPLRPYDQTPAKVSTGAPEPVGQQGNWGIWMTGANRFSRAPGQIDNSVLRRFPSREAAEQFIAQSRAERPDMRTDIEVREIEPGQQSGPTAGGRASNPDGNWIIAPRGQNPPVPLFRFNAAGVDDANTVVNQWNREHAGQEVVVHYDPQQRYGQPPIPGSTLDLQRQRAAAAQQSSSGEPAIWYVSVIGRPGTEIQVRAHNAGEAEGQAHTVRPDIFGDNEGNIRASTVPVSQAAAQQQPTQQPAPQPLGAGRELVGWEVRMGGRPVHTLSGIGNNQGDANRLAQQWILRQGSSFLRQHQGEEVEVVPAWREA